MKQLPDNLPLSSSRMLRLNYIGSGYDASIIKAKGGALTGSFGGCRFAAIDNLLRAQVNRYRAQKTYRHKKYYRRIMAGLVNILIEYCKPYARRSDAVQDTVRIFLQPLVRQ